MTKNLTLQLTDYGSETEADRVIVHCDGEALVDIESLDVDVLLAAVLFAVGFAEYSRDGVLLTPQHVRESVKHQPNVVLKFPAEAHGSVHLKSRFDEALCEHRCDIAWNGNLVPDDIDGRFRRDTFIELLCELKFTV